MSARYPSTAISALRLFGSSARGDADELSDVDILVVLGRSLSRKERLKIEQHLRSHRARVSVAWYSEAALQKMFAAGQLFAFHLAKESVSITGGSGDFIDTLGRPLPYQSALADLAGFQQILEGVRHSLDASPRNAAFEAGLLYVCARNIGMIASTYLADGPFFGRDSPFQLAERTQVQFPLTRIQHNRNMICRTSGHRGFEVDGDQNEVREMASALGRWASSIRMFAAKMDVAA